MSESYQIVSPPGSPKPLDPKRIADLLAKDGQLILPLLDLLENAQCALDDLIDVMGRATLEVVLRMSAETIAAGERLLKDLAGRDFSGVDLLAIWIDGINSAPNHVICAAGVDDKGLKLVLGLREGATENAEVAKALLEDLAGGGVDSKRRRLFVIDGALALRKAVDLIFGVETPVQRCRNHKLRDVLGHLPQAQHDQARSTLKAAFKLDAKEGTAQLQK